MFDKWHAWEIFVASLVGMALYAESSASSLSEDYTKIDLRFAFKNLFEEKSMIHLNCQVKYGDSFRGVVKNGIMILKGIDKKTINLLSGNFSILCWMPNAIPWTESKIYWIWFDNRTRLKRPIRLSLLHYIDPSVRYEISRNYIYHRYHIREPDTNMSKDDITHECAKNEYKKLKTFNITNPLFWKIYVTKFAWQHKTRFSKSSLQRVQSLNVLPYLKEYLSRIPDRYYVQKTEIVAMWNNTKRVNTIICWYNQTLVRENKRFSLLVRLKEEVIYPTDWKSRPIENNEVSCKYTLASWWPKEEK